MSLNSKKAEEDSKELRERYFPGIFIRMASKLHDAGLFLDIVSEGAFPRIKYSQQLSRTTSDGKSLFDHEIVFMQDTENTWQARIDDGRRISLGGIENMSRIENLVEELCKNVPELAAHSRLISRRNHGLGESSRNRG